MLYSCVMPFVILFLHTYKFRKQFCVSHYCSLFSMQAMLQIKTIIIVVLQNAYYIFLQIAVPLKQNIMPAKTNWPGSIPGKLKSRL